MIVAILEGFNGSYKKYYINKEIWTFRLKNILQNRNFCGGVDDHLQIVISNFVYEKNS